MQDEEKAKNSLMLMRTIRADMIELKKQKSVIETLTGSASPMLIWLIALFFTEIHGEEVERFNEERDREEAAVAAQSTRLQSSTETQKEAVVGRERKILRGGQDLKRSILPEYSPKGEPRRELTASRRLIIAKRQDTLSPEAKTSREREKSEKQSKSKVAKTGSTHSRKTEGVQVQKKPLVVQATQSLESTGSTQRSLIMSPKKKTSSVPGVIRKGTSTTKPHKLRTTRRQRRHAGKGKKHKRGKISANASETTDESAQSTMQSNVASPVELPHRECSNVPFSSSAQKTVGTASPKPLSLQKLVGPVIRVDPSAQKVKCTTVSQSPAARKTAKAAQLPVQETVRTVIAKPPSLKIPTSSQMPTQKTCFISPARTVTPAALFQQRTAHPTEPSHLPVRSTRTQRGRYDDSSILTFSTPSQKTPSLPTFPSGKGVIDARSRSAIKSMKRGTPGKHADKLTTSRRSRLSSLGRGISSQKTTSRQLLHSSSMHGPSSQTTTTKLLSARLPSRRSVTPQKTMSRQSLISTRRSLSSQKAHSRQSRLLPARRALSSQKGASRISRLTSVSRGVSSQNSRSRQSLPRGRKVSSQNAATSRQRTARTQGAAPDEAPTQLHTIQAPVITKRKGGTASRKKNQRRFISQ
ncbi:hypothetical protein Tcan_13733 [Toxocara canis]|uniref:Uncharacterized protein n=1 Tax=Toxocara canis TaxID=6265 RepID=A0A0B2UP70_TOXCA|nr:hypothetical protein Tcan_13733 [Toxocara canis]